MEKKKILFIINPVSGTRKKTNIEPYIKDYLDLEIYDPHFEFTKSAGDGFNIALSALQKKFDTVVAVGGDGTINEVARGITGSPVCMGIIPLGSGNGLARHLNIPLRIGDAVRVINECFVLPIDTVQINHTSFFSIAGVGFDALIAKKFALQKRRGFFSYMKITLSEYLRYRQKKISSGIGWRNDQDKGFFYCPGEF